MAYYDRIARQWHAVTGFRGGAFKELVLNDRIIAKVQQVEGCAILELGAGNGYFLPLLLRRFSGQTPARTVVTDASAEMLRLAQRHFRIDGAEYLRLDVRNPYPFPERSFDLILATMVFNEISDVALWRALRECRRVLATHGCLIATVAHPEFVRNMDRRGALRRTAGRTLTMPSTQGLRLPVVRRSMRRYESCFEPTGFAHAWEDVFASEAVLHQKPALRAASRIPLAAIARLQKAG